MEENEERVKRLYDMADEMIRVLADYVRKTSEKENAAPAELVAMTEAANIVVTAPYR